jgi:hypothetical protein
MKETFHSKSKRHRQNVIILSLLAFTLLGLGGWFYYQNKDAGQSAQHGLAKIDQHTGQYRVKRDNNQFPGTSDLIVQPGDRIQTRPDSSLTLAYLDGGVSMDLQGGTIVLFEGPEQGKKFRLQAGRVSLQVSELPEAGLIRIESNNAEATVRAVGRFSIEYQGLKTVFLAHSGRLKVRRIRDGFETTLSADESFCCQPEADQARIEFQDLDL